MKVLYIINGLGFSENTGIGGSDKRAAEIIKKILRFAKVDVLTTSSGRNVLKNDGLEDHYINYITISPPFFWMPSLSRSIFGRIISYFYVTVMCLFIEIPTKEYDIVYATSDFFFDNIPCWFLKRKNKKIKYVSFVHHLVKNLAKRKGSFFINLLLKYSQKFSFWFLNRSADKIFVYNTPEGKDISRYFIKKNYPIHNIYFVENGINFNWISAIPAYKIKYDASFVGGIRPSKGIFDLVPIWKKVCEKKKDAKLVIVGGGTKKFVDKLTHEISSNNLNRNILFRGPLAGIKLFKTIKSSQIFIFPSYEEGWGIAVCEAMGCGLPVIAYDLPAFEIFENAIEKVPIGNIEEFSLQILKILNDDSLLAEKKKLVLEKAKNFDWEIVAQMEYTIFQEILTKSN